MNDFATLCLLGSKECTRIHELVYTDLDEVSQLETAHTMFAVLSLVSALGPMFIVNAWYTPESSKYEVGIIDNGRQDIWRYSYLFYVINYGIPAVISPLTYYLDDGWLRRVYEAWYGPWNMLMMTAFVLCQAFWFWPSPYYVGDYPWQVVFVYGGFYVYHLLVWALFRRDLYRWAYGDDVVENTDGEYFDYCCYSFTSGGAGEAVRSCAIHEEDPMYGDRVCRSSCTLWNFCDWFDTYEDIEAVSGTIMLYEGEKVDFCCNDYNEETD